MRDSGLRLIASGLWVAEAPQRFLGLEMGARMTVMALDGSRLLVHSPVPAESALVQAVRGLGTVAYVVAPSRMHHLYVDAWQQAFPDASVYVAPGVEGKHPELRIAGLLGDAPEPGWADAVDQVLLRGIPMTNEAVFFHRQSATLVASDLAFHVGPSSPPLTRLAFRLFGIYGKLRPTVLERLLVRDRAAFRRSLLRVLAWPFERIVIAHGALPSGDGREALVEGYSWVLGDAAPPSAG